MVNAPSIQFAGNRLQVHFENFGQHSYELFLKVKRLPEYEIEFLQETETYRVSAPARFAPMLGLPAPDPERPLIPFSPFLFDDQLAIVRMALEAKRFAVWSDCGLGKTLIELEWCRQVTHCTGGRVLILTMNDIVPQIIAEAQKFYGDSLPIFRIESREQLRLWCSGQIEGPAKIAITNYEKMNPDDQGQEVHELRHLAGIALDESSRLKTGGGKQKWAIIKSTKGIPYKLSATATPAPNDTMEFASQASFLEKMRHEGEIIWTYFTRDPKSHRWTVKQHAREAFFQWMSGWSIYVKNPKHYGWRLDLPEVPEPMVFEHQIELTEEQREFIFASNAEDGQSRMFGDKDLNTIQRGKQSQAAKGFVYLKGKSAAERVRRIDSIKPGIVANLIAQERRQGLQVLCWTVFDAESDILAEELGRLPSHARPPASEIAILTGNTPDEDRAKILDAFQRGEIYVLISRAGMLGYGMNFQCCGSMVFSGWNDSFEQWYQAIRRAYRFGQTKNLRVHVPVIPELEGQTLENIRRKRDQFERDIAEMEKNYVEAFGKTGLLQATGRAA